MSIMCDSLFVRSDIEGYIINSKFFFYIDFIVKIKFYNFRMGFII